MGQQRGGKGKVSAQQHAAISTRNICQQEAFSLGLMQLIIWGGSHNLMLFSAHISGYMNQF
jgi:hypothetical protein